MTETVMGARRLRESEARLKLATEVAKLGVFVWDTVQDTGSWENDRMYEIFGRKREDGPVNGATFINEVVHPDYRNTFRQAMQDTLQKGEPFRFEGSDPLLRWYLSMHRGERKPSMSLPSLVSRTVSKCSIGRPARMRVAYGFSNQG
jgi:PAS domain-containing protein